ncbi:hypothetical protein [Comamonas sp.]|mgnify:FL=1|uniref:hypothetical protein n=1 Tax=Comamonas sp. TaxID=34028 RepID=UPI0028A25B7F|nr:hypothetical protein [Comamonas sp.]
MWTRRLMWIVWPAFLAAGVMEMLVFAAFDPHDMLWLGKGIELSRTAIYTLAFFAFWAVFVAAGYLTVLLSISAAEVNAQPSM